MVRFENVGLRYGLGPEILRDLSFMIPAHSFQFLTGPSGAGKTSLLRLLFLSIRPTRGLVNLFGEDVSLLGKDQVANMRQKISTSRRVRAASRHGAGCVQVRTTPPNDDELVDALLAGANGVLTCADGIEELYGAVRAVSEPQRPHVPRAPPTRPLAAPRRCS